MPADTIVVVAARNEAERIAATLAGLARAFPGAPVWVADDGSCDGTARLADAAGARVVRGERAIGKGGAMTLTVAEVLADVREDQVAEGVGLVGGTCHACARAHARTRGKSERVSTPEPMSTAGRTSTDAERIPTHAEPRVTRELVLVLCDGDLGESASELAPLAQAVRDERCELAVAAFRRRLGGGFGLTRGFARWAIRRRCGLEASAPVSGQRAIAARTLADVLPFARGFGMEIGMTIDAARAGHRVLEFELDLEHRTHGRSRAGFAHRGRQLVDSVRAYWERR